MAAITIKDVAREANVSVASVSRAMNGNSGVTAETGQRIREVAKRLRYVPHTAARSLITKRTNTIGALLPDLYGEFFSELIRGIDLAARARGLHLLVSSSHDDAAEAATAIRSMQGRVDGLLLMSPHADVSFLKEHLPEHLPTVLMNAVQGGHEYTQLAIDNTGGATAMVRHLLLQGRRRIAFIRGPANNRDVTEREQAYRDALATARAGRAGQAAIVLTGDFSEQSGYRAGQELLAMQPRPDAIFAANDMMAIGCLSALRAAGVRVPQEIAVAGFDDVPMARYVTPPLTTVRVRIAELGAQALTQLAAQIASDTPFEPSHQRVSTELVVRASSSADATPESSFFLGTQD